MERADAGRVAVQHAVGVAQRHGAGRRERAEAIDLYQFTKLIRDGYDLGQKTLLAEIMWGLILTDGEIAHHEAYMLRKIANLLDLKPGYLAEARKRVAGED